MRAGVARIDIAPAECIWMEGMLRAHRSEGVHEPIFAKALVLSNDEALDQACAIVAVDVCGMRAELTDEVRGVVERELGIPAAHTIIAAKHIHSGPDTDGDGWEDGTEVRRGTDPLDPDDHPLPIGGIIVPVNRLDLLAPWVGLVAVASLAAVALAFLVQRYQG